MVIDGARAASAATSALERSTAGKITIIGIAKRLEESISGDQGSLPDKKSSHFVLSQFRDEAHRSALLSTTETTPRFSQSDLINVPGSDGHPAQTASKFKSVRI